MNIRFYKKDDYTNLKKLLKEVGLYVEPNDSEEIITKQYEQDNESILVVEDKNKIIASVIVVYSPWNSFIFHLAVLPEYQNKGIGSELLLEAEKTLKNKGAKKYSLFVYTEKEKLIEFYKKRGWNFDSNLSCFEKIL